MYLLVKRNHSDCFLFQAMGIVLSLLGDNFLCYENALKRASEEACKNGRSRTSIPMLYNKDSTQEKCFPQPE